MGPICIALAACVASMPGGREATLAFEDVTAQAGLPTTHNALWGANWYDSNADGWLDLHLNGHFQPPLLFEYLGDQTFRDVSYRFPTDKPPPQDRHSFLFGDFNRDGFPDLYVVHGGGEDQYPDGSQWNELLYYDPVADQYVDVTAGTGLEDPYGRGRGAALFDFNGDGVVDLYKTNTATTPPPPNETPCLACLGDLAGNFTRDPNSGLELIIGTWGAPLPCDYDNDGDTDVFVRGAGGGPTGVNALLRNDGGVFTNVTAAAGLGGTRNNAGAAWGDYDNDGWMDLVIAHENTPPGATLALYHNQADGTFSSATSTGLDRVGVFEELAWADFDNDGWLDLYVGAYYLDGESTRNLLYHNRGDGSFEEVALAAGVPATIGGMDPVVALADYDRDGLVDIFTGVGFFRPFQDPELPLYLYRNVTPTANTYLEIELRGPAGNERAIGTRIYVSRGALVQVRQQYAGVGHHSEDAPVLHFGTGDENRAIAHIYWPNGSELDYCTHTNRYCVLTYYAGPPILTDGPLVGAVTAHSGMIFARTSSASTVQVRYSPNSDLSGALWSDPVLASADKDFTALVSLRDLPAETRIYYDILVDGTSQLPPPRPSFVTFPEQATAFTVGLLSDLANTDLGRNAPAYAALSAVDPALVIQLGDFDHRNPSCLACMRQMHREVRSPVTAAGSDFHTYIARQVPFFHVWDDHDLGENNADKTFPGKADALAAFKEYYPTPPLPNPQAGIWHSFSYGQADFFLLDCRSQRDPATDADGPDKSMLDGDELPDGQKQWLLQGLLQSAATWKFIVSSVPFNAGCKAEDSWGAYPTERQEILDFVGQNNIGGVIVISGDAHTGGAIDNGTHSGLPEISVPHTNLSPEGSEGGQACPESVWSEGRIPGKGNPDFALLCVETNPDAVWLETYGEDGTLRQSYHYVLPLASGACCRNYDETCDDDVSARDCSGPQDTWHPDATCGQIACPTRPTGSCCFADGTCQVMAETDCATAGGTYQGDGTLCVPNRCPPTPATGACCFADGTCQVMAETDCTTAGGTYQGDGTPCVPNRCPPTPATGACCLADGSCQRGTQAECAAVNGTYEGNNSSCDNAVCPQAPCAYTLTTAVQGQGTAAAHPTRRVYDCGATVQLTATPAECWHFVRWEGNWTRTDNPMSLTMDGNRTLMAVFEKDEYKLDVSIAGDGGIALDPPAATGGMYACGTTVQLKAMARPGSHFARWAGDVSGSDVHNSVLVTGHRQVTAVFEADEPEMSEESSNDIGDTSDVATTTDTGTTGNDGTSDESPPGLSAQDAPAGFGGVCPAASGGIIGLTLAGLLRSRTGLHRPPSESVSHGPT